MNQHVKTSKLLVDFALGDLSPEAKIDIRAHLARCSRCADELKRLEALVAGTERIREFSVGPEAVEVAERTVLSAVKNQQVKEPTSGPIISPESIWRMTMSNRRMKLAGMAAIVIVVLGGVTFWPSDSPGNGQWWLGSPAVWGKEIIAEMERIETLVHREQAVFVGRYGDTHVSGNWSRVYEAADRSREDKYYENTDESTFGDNSPDSVLVEVTWKVPDGKDLKAYHVSHEHKCYTIETTEGGAYKRDPMKMLRWYVGLMDRADRVLDTKIFDGRECVGFEIDTSKYGSNPKGRTDRIWFDVETKLPVRIEKHGLPVTDSPGQTFTFIDDRFEYYAKIPVDKFVPKIPDGYINASTHEVRAAKDKQQKGDMPYADVPEGLRDEVAGALSNVVTASYREHFGFMRGERWLYSDGSKLYIAPQAWREDHYSGERVNKTDFFVTDKEDWGKTSFDFNDQKFKLTQTTVDFNDRNYRVVTHGSKSHPNNPMDRIIRIASMLNRADHFWDREMVNGVECFGFELSAKKYGSNPDTHKHRMWFDKLTKLPVKTEFAWVQSEGPRRKICEHFQWNPAFGVETFVPEIPEDFTVKDPN